MSSSASEKAIEFTFQLQGDNVSILDVALSIPGRGVTAVFGPSGAGKTSLLRCIAGLQQATGRLIVNGEVWQDESVFVPTHQRRIGYVFQESSLFNHLSVQGNLDFGVKRSAASIDEGTRRHVIELMALGPLLDRSTSGLSGGERQRVAIARALLTQPQLLLMDEPMASLDAARKQEIFPYLEQLHEELDIPVLYVSHQMDEVSRLADHLVLLNAGEVVAHGPLTEVLSRLDIPFDEDAGVVLEGGFVERDDHWHLVRVATSGGDIWVRDQGAPLGEATRVRILARDISLARQVPEASSIQNFLPVQVVQIEPDRDEAMALVRLKSGDDFLVARITRRAVAGLQLEPGESLTAQIKAAAIVR